RNHDRINYADQLSDPDSILHFYRKMITLRAASEVLIDGTFHLLHASRHLAAYERILDQARWIILLNFSTRERSAKRFVPDGTQLVLSSTGSQAFSGMLQPYEAVILRKEADK
ncbi:DUF3459 domain-containing protein, partial [bacterium]|nr:DUF3459 domain-containing protein [bacterium]